LRKDTSRIENGENSFKSATGHFPRTLVLLGTNDIGRGTRRKGRSLAAQEDSAKKPCKFGMA